jgi:hypothetical protein
MASGILNQEPEGPLASAEADSRLEELEQIVHSETFMKSPRLSSLLRYISERSWNGKTEDLSEQQIGIHFFHRAPGFNASDDAIVRGSARHLRKRLDLYYEREGRNSKYRLTVPKGGYVAHFDPAPEVKADAPGDPESNSVETGVRTSGMSRQMFFWPLVVVVVLLAAVVGELYLHSQRRKKVAIEAINGPLVLWQAIFTPSQKTLIVPGDPALNLYTAYKHREVPLVDYTEQSYQHDKDIAEISPEGPGAISNVNMASMPDLQLVSELMRVPYRAGMPMGDDNIEVRYARDLREADLSNANLILLGAATFDPWVSIYDSKLDFQLHRGFEHYTFEVIDRAPHPGETSVITKKTHEALTIVALTDTPSGNERVLLVEGTTLGSIYAALHFLFTKPMWQPVIQQAFQGGKLHNFEVVLQSDFIRDEVSNTHVLAVHIH